MTRTEGEHELVLGNKQLLSAFFVVVVLLGVFFTMGYFVGKNSATAGFNSGPSGTSGGSRPDPAGKAPDPTPSTAAPDSTASASDPNAAATAPAPSPETSSPAMPAPAPPERSEAKPVDAKPAPPKSGRAPVEEVSAPPERMAQPSSEQMYLQIAAVRRTDADNMLKVLREHHFPALLGESSKPGLYRVLVGPFKTVSELGHAKSDLKAKGFDSIVAK